MADGIELATAYVRIVPTTEGIKGNLTTAIQPEADTAGKTAGDTMGSGLLSSFSKATGGLGKKFSDIGSTVSKTVSVPMAAAATATMASWKQVDDGFDTVIQKTGATGDALKGMQDSVQNIATSMPVSFQDAGTAIGEVNTRFGITGDQLEGLSKQFLEFAQINGTDVNGSIDNVQKALSAFGLSADDAGAMLDTLNKVGQDTGISMDTLESEMVANGASFREMGFSASDAATLLGTLEKSGINTQDVMVGLKKAMAESQSTGESMGDVLQRAFGSAGDASDIFGAKAGPALYNAMQSGILSMDMFTAGTIDINDALGSTSDTFEAMQDPADQWQTVLNNLMVLGYQIGEAVMPTITSVVQTLIPVIQQMCDAWNSLSPGMQDTIVKAALIAAGIGPIISGMGGVLSGISTITGAAGNLFNFLKPFAAAITGFIGAHPVIFAIAAVVAAVIALYTKCEWFRDGVNSIFSAIVNFAKGAWDTLKSGISSLVSWFSNAFQTIGNTATNIWNSIARFGTGAWNTIKGVWSGVTGFFNGIWNDIKNGASIIWSGITGIFSSAIDRIKGLFNFHFSWPHIPLPHFSISGSANPLKWLTNGVPHISVSWYAKAMQQPYLLDGATIFGASGNNLLGGGETGKEIVMSEAYLKNLIAASSESAARTITNAPTINLQVYASDNMDVSELADEVMDRINTEIARGKRAFS